MRRVEACDVGQARVIFLDGERAGKVSQVVGIC